MYMRPDIISLHIDKGVEASFGLTLLERHKVLELLVDRSRMCHEQIEVGTSLSSFDLPFLSTQGPPVRHALVNAITVLVRIS